MGKDSVLAGKTRKEEFFRGWWSKIHRPCFKFFPKTDCHDILKSKQIESEAGMKILVIEDSNEKYMAIDRVLRRIGVDDPSWVTNLQDGLSLIVEEENKAQPFDFVITDMHYPPA